MLSSLPEVVFPIPAYMRRGPAVLPGSNVQTRCLWENSELLKIKINCATYVNVKELDKVGPALEIIFVFWNAKLVFTELMCNPVLMKWNIVQQYCQRIMCRHGALGKMPRSNVNVEELGKFGK